MMLQNYKAKIVCFVVQTLLLFSIVSPLHSQASGKRNLYFYGTQINLAQDSVATISTDLFYSQFQIDNSYTVYDRRNTLYTDAVLDIFEGTSSLVFYAEVFEKDGRWNSILHIIDFEIDKEFTASYIYEEDYKVLLDAKKNLNDLLASLDDASSSDVSYSQSQNTSQSISNEQVTITNLFGTWKGEQYIEKVVILRGGRGFVIFENGASMNITIAQEGETLVALQESKANASFFPELPREVALVKALEVNPIKWELTIENENLLSGVKHTYVAEYDESGNLNVVEDEIPVRWQR